MYSATLVRIFISALSVAFCVMLKQSGACYKGGNLITSQFPGVSQPLKWVCSPELRALPLPLEISLESELKRVFASDLFRKW